MTHIDAQRLFESLNDIQRDIGEVKAQVAGLVARMDADAESDKGRDLRIAEISARNADALGGLDTRVRRLEDWKLKVVTAVAIAGGAGAAVGTAAEQVIRAITGG